MPKSALRQQLNLSEAVEDYMKAIYQLREEQLGAVEDARVTTTALAMRLGVMPGSVTGMVRKLADLGLVTHQPYHGVSLTVTGAALALEIVRHHRLLELYLTRIVGFDWHEVHEQADALEHAISEEFEDRIDAMLGSPMYDPHGDPIPSKLGQVEAPTAAALIAVAPDAVHIYTILRVLTQDSEMLCYLKQLALVPGTHIRVIERPPFGGSLRLQIVHPDLALVERQISPHLASVILVVSIPSGTTTKT